MSARVNLVWIDRSAPGSRPRVRVGVTVERMPVVSSTAIAGIPVRPLSE